MDANKDIGQFHLRPLAQARQVWRELLTAVPDGSLYHRERWFDLIARAYRLELWLATIERGSEIRAGCLFARSKNPFAGSLVALPFSDLCPPLSVSAEAENALLNGLIASPAPRGGYEIRGVTAPPPWSTVNCFVTWSLDLAQPLAAIERSLNRNFRRNIQAAEEADIKIERGRELGHVERFYSLQLETRRRLGVPPQPLRFFKLVHEMFSADGSIEVWLAVQGGRDLMAAILLRDRDCLYVKWSARAHLAPKGVNHLLLWNCVEEFAGKARVLDLGRTDVRNPGLSRFKRETGASASPLPYIFFPRPPHRVSSEVLTGPYKALSRLWRHLPLAATQMLGSAFYGYLA